MNIKKLLISESERRDILLKYNIIREQQDDVKKSLELNKKVNF